MDDKARPRSACAVGNLVWQPISLAASPPVDRRPPQSKVIHSNLQQAHRFSGSNGVSAAGGLWMNLWKLWIARHC